MCRTRRTRKSCFLILELVIALFLVVTCLFPLLKPNIELYQLEQRREEIEAQAEALKEAHSVLSSKNDALQTQQEEILLKNVELEQQNEEIEAQAESLREANQMIGEQKENLTYQFQIITIISGV